MPGPVQHGKVDRVLVSDTLVVHKGEPTRRLDHVDAGSVRGDDHRVRLGDTGPPFGWIVLDGRQRVEALAGGGPDHGMDHLGRGAPIQHSRPIAIGLGHAPGVSR
ncbi:MAG: hypothetical protein OXE86_05030 [Alphaproteobacteria bacterium]|nr:hypothetical protein [Alphaproteobacteria bacterium]